MKNEKMFCSLASDVTAPWTTARQSWAPPPAPHEHLPTSARHRLRPFATRRKARQDAWFPGMPGADATRFSAEKYDYDNPEHQICYTKRKGAPGCLCINIKSVLHILLSLGPFIIECFVTELSSPNAHPAGCKVVAEQVFAIQSLC